jgi:hypothetical protein
MNKSRLKTLEKTVSKLRPTPISPEVIALARLLLPEELDLLHTRIQEKALTDPDYFEGKSHRWEELLLPEEFGPIRTRTSECDPQGFSMNSW